MITLLIVNLIKKLNQIVVCRVVIYKILISNVFIKEYTSSKDLVLKLIESNLSKILLYL